jgi:phenylpyruvate tautomerase PptA (4-oxalocrotonate tautomerase family)
MTKKCNFNIALTLILLFSSSFSSALEKKNYITYVETEEIESFNWIEISPIKFIDFLKKKNACVVSISDFPPEDWIKEKHLEKLYELINSIEPCAQVVSVYSSKAPLIVRSTVGKQAVFFLRSFMNKKYPKFATAEDSLTIKEIDEIKNWYINNKNK